MARYVKVASLAPDYLPLAGRRDTSQAAVNHIIEFWQQQIEAVLPDQPDLIVLPECCDRYPDHTPDERRAYYAVRGEQVRDALARIAQTNRCYIVYPAIWPMPDGTWRNTAQLIGRDGNLVGQYHKNFPVITETEQDGILCGAQPTVLPCDFGRVGFAICFDLNFEPLRNAYARLKPDLLVFPSMFHGSFLQQAWAHACRAHFVSSIWDLPSAALSPVGHAVAQTTNYFRHFTVTLNLDCRVIHLDFNWEKLRAMKRKYGPEARFTDPGLLGAVLISSESDRFTADDLVREFGFELLDDYMARSTAHRENPAHREAVAIK